MTSFAITWFESPLAAGSKLGWIRLQSMAMGPSTPADQPTDGEPSELEQQRRWMREVADGDAHAYRALCDRFLGPITGFSQRMLANQAEAEEVAQETFLRVWKDARRYAPTAAVSTWIYRIAHNLCVDRLRRRRETSDRISDLNAGDRTSDLFAQKQLATRVNDALAALPERQRTAICLVHYEGLSQTEAAAVLQVGTEALESLLSRGRRTLRKKLARLREGAGDHDTHRGEPT